MADELGDLLRATGRLLAVPVIFKDLTRATPADRQIGQHQHPACLARKAEEGGHTACHRFCTQRCAIELAELPAGRTHTCPFGHSEVVVPVLSGESFIGWLCAGPLWRGRGPPPHPALTSQRSRRWYEDCRRVLVALAARVASLAVPADAGSDDRALRIHRWLHGNLADPIGLADLAAHLGLSPSRCGHVVREALGETFPRLLRRIRCRRAARLLAATDEPVAEVGSAVGIPDPSWFTASFRAEYGLTPSAWRQAQRHETGA